MIAFKNWMLALFMAAVMFSVSGPLQVASAGMVSTSEFSMSVKAEEAREYVSSVMARDDFRNELMSMGVAPEEAEKRVQGLSDAEVIALSGKLKNAPAGGDLGGIVGALVLIFLVLLFTDIMGYTNVYKFTR
ncbi:PA2779 family protein [Limisalsivibrio acetivorans]|uniref:PA2779 family protein n=1 Tax=Limisalsivibrio acetivorans TaxID=1304888 RepID=UPI0003B301FF|nr:PA2779 family protein [Limisalsivibrio acetivorans]